MKRVFLIILLLLVAVDLGWVNYEVFLKKNLIQENKDLSTIEVKTDDNLNQRVDELEREISDLKSASKSADMEKTTPTVVIQSNKTKHINYLPISGSLSQVAYDWVSVSGSQFYFNKTDYTGLKEIKFESNMKLLNGNGMAFVRLFDLTHGVAVTKSQVQTAYQNDTVVISEPINFMDGNNLIEVQIKSLTADSTVFNSGRLVISSEY